MKSRRKETHPSCSLCGHLVPAQARRKPKVPKGARDFLPDQMAIREVGRA